MGVDPDLTGKIALVTGSARRVGRVIVRRIASLGADVVIHYRKSEEAASDLCGELRQDGVRAWIVRADLTNEAEVKGMFAWIEDKLGRLDFLVNNASTFNANPRSDMDDVGSFLQAYKENVGSAIACTLHASKLMDQGVVVNIGDYLGLEPTAGYSAHCISKSALFMMTRCFAMEFGPKIRINIVVPGIVCLTEGLEESQLEECKERTIIGTPGRADDVADAVVFLLGASYVTGAILRVDGGRFGHRAR